MLRHGEAAHDAVSGQTDEFGVVSTPHIFGAIGQDEHTVGVQRMDRSLVVGDEDNSATEVSDSVENLCSASRIEVICWFIKEQHVGRRNDQSRQSQTCLLYTSDAADE